MKPVNSKDRTSIPKVLYFLFYFLHLFLLFLFFLKWPVMFTFHSYCGWGWLGWVIGTDSCLTVQSWVFCWLRLAWKAVVLWVVDRACRQVGYPLGSVSEEAAGDPTVARWAEPLLLVAPSPLLPCVEVWGYCWLFFAPPPGTYFENSFQQLIHSGGKCLLQTTHLCP